MKWVNRRSLSSNILLEKFHGILRKTDKLRSALTAPLVPGPGRVLETSTLPVAKGQRHEFRHSCSSLEEETNHTFFAQPPILSLFFEGASTIQNLLRECRIGHHLGNPFVFQQKITVCKPTSTTWHIDSTPIGHFGTKGAICILHHLSSC